MADSPEKNVSKLNKGDEEIYHHQGSNLPEPSRHDADVLNEKDVGAYWRENINLLVKLLVVWFLVSFGFGILFVDYLNHFDFLGMKLGFWFAQQGSIYVFIILIFTYVIRINQIERRYGIDDSEDVKVEKITTKIAR
ncbi:MAG: putative solute:sodium symporter small subunit [Oceanicoccus sp.]|jgi:putative solute:sodium symporter small subunit